VRLCLVVGYRYMLVLVLFSRVMCGVMVVCMMVVWDLSVLVFVSSLLGERL